MRYNYTGNADDHMIDLLLLRYYIQHIGRAKANGILESHNLTPLKYL